jgi:hypothetical protein
MKLGIEMEFWVVNEAGELCDGAEVIGAHERVRPEFIGPLVEVQTAPRKRETDLRRELQRTLRAALRAADDAGKALVPLGTPLTGASPPASGERGRLFEAIYGESITAAKNCAGTHVHFEKGDVGSQLDMLTALDPALALLNSSPYYRGERRVDSSRAAAYRGAPGFERFCALRPYGDPATRRERTAASYRAFREAAAERGVEPERVDEQFEPENAALNPVRLREELPTVEWRAPDTALPGQAVRLAVDVRDALAGAAGKPIETVADPADSGVCEGAAYVPEFGDLRALSGEAIRVGLGSPQVRSYLDRMGLDHSVYRPIARRLGGPGSLRESDARAIRLRYAERLRADVAALADPEREGAVRPRRVPN